MWRSFTSAFATLCLVACSSAGTGGDTTIDVTDYGQSCNQNTDCVIVPDGDVCLAGCSCSDKAIAESDEAAFNADFDAINATCGPIPAGTPCAGCVESLPICVGGSCTTREVRMVTTEGVDKSCTVDDDCTVVYEGDVCSTCKCPGAAIAKSAEPAYNSAFQGNECGTSEACAADCAVAMPTCQDGVCTL